MVFTFHSVQLSFLYNNFIALRGDQMVKSAQSIVHPVLKIRVSNDFFGRDEMIIGGRSQEFDMHYNCMYLLIF